MKYQKSIQYLVIALMAASYFQVGCKKASQQDGVSPEAPVASVSPPKQTLDYDLIPKGAACPEGTNGLDCFQKTCELAGGNYDEKKDECSCQMSGPSLFVTRTSGAECASLQMKPGAHDFVRVAPDSSKTLDYVGALLSGSFTKTSWQLVSQQIIQDLGNSSLQLSPVHGRWVLIGDFEASHVASFVSESKFLNAISGYAPYDNNDDIGLYEAKLKFLPLALGVSFQRQIDNNQVSQQDLDEFQSIGSSPYSDSSRSIHQKIKAAYDQFRNERESSDWILSSSYMQDETGCNTHCILSKKLGWSDEAYESEFKKVYVYGTPFSRLIVIRAKASQQIAAVISLNVAETVSFINEFTLKTSRSAQWWSHSVFDRNWNLEAAYTKPQGFSLESAFQLLNR